MKTFVQHKIQDTNNSFKLSSVVNDKYTLPVSNSCDLNHFFSSWSQRKPNTFKNYIPGSMTCKIDFSTKNSDINDIYHNYDSNTQLYNKQLQMVSDTLSNIDSHAISMMTTMRSNMTEGNIIDIQTKPRCFLVEKYVGLLQAINLPQIFSNYFPKLKIFAIIRNPTDRYISRAYFGKTEKKARKEMGALRSRKHEKSHKTYPENENVFGNTNPIAKNYSDESLTIIKYYYNKNFKNNIEYNKMSIDYQLNHQLDDQCFIFSNQLENAISQQKSFSLRQLQIYFV